MLENGFVLLTNNNFNTAQLINDLQSNWNITATDAESNDNSTTFTIDGFLCAIALMPAPIPAGEAERQAQGNYYCQDAVEIAKAHQAHLMVTVMNQTEGVEIDGMTLYSKIISSCLAQANATGVYTSGTVFSAGFYNQVCQQYLAGNQPADSIPAMVWVFVGLGQNENGNQLYTVGMEKFGKAEMEILDTKLDMQTMHGSLLSMCSHIITSGLVLKDGETIGFSAEQKWSISHSPSVYAPSENSLKISVS